MFLSCPPRSERLATALVERWVRKRAAGFVCLSVCLFVLFKLMAKISVDYSFIPWFLDQLQKLAELLTRKYQGIKEKKISFEHLVANCGCRVGFVMGL